ncbi:MAG: MFS transporter, partial [Oscillospiraceae bacterium]|nr:MFS transporter [Oscillospiraceae bacterium]
IFASSWTGVLRARVPDRLGKGIRTSPRDVMVSESADKTKMGFAFGLHKALDMAGSAIGILAAFLLVLKYTGGNYRPIFLISLIPMAFALGMFAFIHEDKSPREAVKREPLLKNIKKLDGRLKLYLVVVTLFTLGNSSNTFLLLRAGNEGFSDTSVILLYFVYNVSASVLAIPLGKLSDRIGRKSVLVAGYLTFSAVYFGFAFVSSKPLMAAVFVLYGVYTAMTAGVERAFIAEIAPPSLKGTMLGLESTLVGIALLPASIIAGALWDGAGAFAPFTFGAALSLVAALTLAFGLKAPEKQTK